jgi:hypothetical protein
MLSSEKNLVMVMLSALSGRLFAGRRPRGATGSGIGIARLALVAGVVAMATMPVEKVQ